MKKLGGTYLRPITFFSNDYEKGDFNQKEFWMSEQKSWGRIVHKLPHQSTSTVIRKGNQQNLSVNSDILISIDGLIATEVPDCVSTNEEVLIALSNHLSSFLSMINLGGYYFAPISEKNLAHIKYENSKISQVSGGGDNYSIVSMERALYRYQIPFHNGTPIIDFDWVGMRILNEGEFKDCYSFGKEISQKLNFKNTELVLSLEAFSNYTMHKWNNTLLLGWAFLEILIDRIWENSILASITDTEIKRKKRLEDNRTYSASVKTELLYISEIIDLDTYNCLNKLRNIRNSLIHKGKAASESDVTVIFELTKSIIQAVTELEPKLYNPGWTRAGGWINS